MEDHVKHKFDEQADALREPHNSLSSGTKEDHVGLLFFGGAPFLTRSGCKKVVYIVPIMYHPATPSELSDN